MNKEFKINQFLGKLFGLPENTISASIHIAAGKTPVIDCRIALTREGRFCINADDELETETRRFELVDITDK